MTIGSGLGGFTAGASQLSAAGTSTASDSGNDMMGQIEQTAAMQMKFQTEMGIIQMIIKMNEALAKMFKAIGTALASLA